MGLSRVSHTLPLHRLGPASDPDDRGFVEVCGGGSDAVLMPSRGGGGLDRGYPPIGGFGVSAGADLVFCFSFCFLPGVEVEVGVGVGVGSLTKLGPV